MKKQVPITVKSAGFALLVQVIATVLAFCSLNFNDGNKMAVLISLAVVLVCLIPVYFSIKGMPKRPWFYLIITAASYIILSIISYVILLVALESRESSAFFKVNAELYILLIEAVVIVQLVAIVLLDITFMLFRKAAHYVKNHRPIVIAFLSGAVFSLLVVFIVATVSSFKNFDSNISSIMPPKVVYWKDDMIVEFCEASLDSTFAMPLTITSETYFGTPDKSEYIHIAMSNDADIYIYRNDDNSVIVLYNPQGFGFTQKYVASESFEYYMQQLYRQTGAEGFNAYPEG